jgi:SAM-dependent methyltransferase
MKQLIATEKRDIGQVVDELPETDAAISMILRRVGPHCERLRPGAPVLEIGAAQGGGLVALTRAGYEARGVEPWEPAIETARALEAEIGIELDIVQGWGEALPFDDESFDFVLCLCVMEHVRDPLAVMREANRVLRPGGGFYVYTTTTLWRSQNEIAGFPLFPWYPAPVKRRIMRWAAERRPSLVGGTEMPALNWFTPWGIRRDLRRAGFAEVLERWDLAGDADLDGWRLRALEVVRSRRALRFVGEFAMPGSGYLALK